jgi:FkbM family methyltransferase
MHGLDDPKGPLSDLIGARMGYVNVELADVMLRFIEPGHFVVDAGANQGDFTFIMSRLVGLRGLVLAFEPDREIFERLERNTEFMVNVERRREALWSKDCLMKFHRTALSGYSSFLPLFDSVQNYEVEARSLDSFIKNPQPNFIKIDCEGADEHVLRGAERILTKGVNCVLAEIHYMMLPSFESSETTMRQFMDDIGYDCFLLESNQPPRHYPAERPIDRFPTVGAKAVNVMFADLEHVNELWKLGEKETRNG